MSIRSTSVEEVAAWNLLCSHGCQWCRGPPRHRPTWSAGKGVAALALPPACNLRVSQKSICDFCWFQ